LIAVLAAFTSEMYMPDQPRTTTRTDRLRDRLRYHLDNLLSRGTWAVLLFLGVVVFVVLLLSAVLLSVSNVALSSAEGGSFLEEFWQSMLRAIDPGTMADDVGWGTRLLALLITIFGILVAGTLIGLIASGVEQRVKQMQRGRSAVVESGHVVILGASDRIPIVVNQLTMANRKRRGNAIVVLAEQDPTDLSEAVRSVVTDTRGCRLVFRWGDPTRRSDLAMVGVQDARAVMVLADEDARGDAGVVKAVLAAGAELGGFDRIPIVAELTDGVTADSLTRACGGQVFTVVAAQAAAGITAFSLAEPGLTKVVEELLSFAGADIYIRPLGDLDGAQFGESVYHFSKARPIGRLRSNGDVEINPAPETRLGGGDSLVVIADDDSPILATNTTSDHPPFLDEPPPPLEARRRELHLLIIGWNALGPRLLDQIEHLAAPGSSVDVVYDSRLFAPDELNIPTSTELKATLTPTKSDTWSVAESHQMPNVDTVVLLGYRRGTSVEEADSRTLLTLMLLKRRLQSLDRAPPRIIAELLDVENVDLALLTGADDYVVSDAITSRLMTQLADQPERRAVLRELYGPTGSSIHLVGASELGLVGQCEWNEIVVAAYSSGLLAIGWRLAGPAGGDPVLNPDGSDRVVLADDDHVVVIG
jgi:hypothetical protein